ERVADVVRHVLDLGHLVVVREDYRVAGAGQLADLAAHSFYIARDRAPGVCGSILFQVQNFYRHVLVTSRLRSNAGAECVSAPTEIRSTPAFAAATGASRLNPPDASKFARPAGISPARRSRSEFMLSSRIISAPA